MHDEHSQSNRPADEVSEAGRGTLFIDGSSKGGRRRRRRTDWRAGGRAISRWNAKVLIFLCFAGGVGMFIADAIGRSQESWAPTLSLLTLWAAMLMAVTFALVRSQPAGLLRFRPLDLLWGLGIGLILRMVQGFIGGANLSAFPALQASGDQLGGGSTVAPVIYLGMAGAVVEELFFRMLLLVVLFQMLRRTVGPAAAGMTALLVSTGGFVLLHAFFSAISLVDAMQFFLLGATCSLLVLLTGRVWGAVLVHLVYNGTLLALVFVGAAAG